MTEWVATNGTNVLMVIISGLAVYALLITLTRLAGVRSFSKMSAFDFAITIATGSVAASIIVMKDPPLLQGAVALITLYLMQLTLARLREVSPLIAKLVDNEPRLIMIDGEMIDDQMKAAKITKDDLYAKLREANVTQMDQVYAVIAETTGDISVLHGPPEDGLDERLLHGVRAAGRYDRQPLA